MLKNIWLSSPSIIISLHIPSNPTIIKPQRKTAATSEQLCHTHHHLSKIFHTHDNHYLLIISLELMISFFHSFLKGAFFIPYFVCLFGAGVPVYFLEVAIGQYWQNGGITVWRLIQPIMKGNDTLLMIEFGGICKF